MSLFALTFRAASLALKSHKMRKYFPWSLSSNNDVDYRLIGEFEGHKLVSSIQCWCCVLFAGFADSRRLNFVRSRTTNAESSIKVPMVACNISIPFVAAHRHHHNLLSPVDSRFFRIHSFIDDDDICCTCAMLSQSPISRCLKSVQFRREHPKKEKKRECNQTNCHIALIVLANRGPN